MRNVSFGTMTLDGLEEFRIGLCFRNPEIGQKTMRGSFLPFKFISDAAYPMRP